MVILIVFISLIGLIVLHEFGHFAIAKKFGVRVEEFGIGYPPRIFGKKIGETLYSLNLLPFGAFVKIYGEEGGIESAHSFTGKPIWQRALIILGGVVSFWIISAILLSIVFGMGVPQAISDTTKAVNPKVQIVAVASGSPAEEAGIKVGDTIKEFSIFNSQFSINKVKEIQELTEKYKGEAITLTIERGKEVFDATLIPRVSPPEGEGAMGVGLVRTALTSYPWYLAPIKGVEACFNLTGSIVAGLSQVFGNLIQGKGLPPGAQLMGPIGIGSLMTQAAHLGLAYYLQFIALISIYLAIFNILPIPALDGGKLLFLGIEKVRRKPVSQKIEQGITSIFFALLIALMIWVTIKDISRLF
ncbi:MAG: RIP metalloprotease RseP [Candidatus Nealsonbacteria bacterium]|nr:MAG: RIP metalloprotease RseP [Candidatus Nealsonbacteria bacterium]